MKNFTFILALFFTSTVIAQIGFEKDHLTFKLCLIKSETNSGVTEMTLYNTDKKFYVSDSICITNSSLQAAEFISSQKFSQIMVKLTERGRLRFSNFTKNNIGHNAAIVIDGVLVSAPVIRAQIDNGQFMIMGLFSREEAYNIVDGIIDR